MVFFAGRFTEILVGHFYHIRKVHLQGPADPLEDLHADILSLGELRDRGLADVGRFFHVLLLQVFVDQDLPQLLI